ncbi:complement C1q-like protein 4 [Ostrea edulis]|uniref:complement C1q-like protein 4 n=1 Tax=Ostrea edulis TaxID=37623 RepID=UPI0024AEBC81|nr:complement C1q-like protein 4 [Ostrea edulis]
MDSHADKTKGNGNMTLSRTRSLDPTNRKYETHRKGRLLTSQSPSVSDVTTIAFYAYMSNTLPSAEATVHHVLIFDVVKTNVGNAYNPFSGIFIAPETGVYVFSWGFLNGEGSHHSVQLMVNADEMGVVHSHTVGIRNYAQSTGVVTCLVNKVDDVFLRLNDANGPIVSNIHGKTFFTGWKLN